MEKPLFREKNINQITSPDELNDYLKVTNTSVWTILVAVILLLSGLLVWASIGHLDTYAEANVIAKDKQLQIIVADQRAKMVKDGMTLNIEGEEVVIENVKLDEYGRALATGELDIKDGEYTGKVVVESVHPISFLLK